MSQFIGLYLQTQACSLLKVPKPKAQFAMSVKVFRSGIQVYGSY